MFEGKLPPPPGAQPQRDGESLLNPLRTVEWADLAAKLAAARDLRAALLQSGGTSRPVPERPQARVNPEDSANRKTTAGMDGAAPPVDGRGVSRAK